MSAMGFPPPKIIGLERLREALDKPAVFAAVERALIAHAAGEVESPLPGHLLFPHVPGDCHLKFGYLKSSPFFVIKVATGFYANEAQGLPVNNGLNLVFSQTSGALLYLLLDQGWLTSWRTAAAGALAASRLAPPRVEAIGMIGAGHQAYLQLEWLRELTPCRRVRVWGRTAAKAAALAHKLAALGYRAEACESREEVVRESQILFTATSSDRALVEAEWVAPGTTIVALGADNPGKKELATAIFERATRAIADDVRQCASFGEIGYAIREGILKEEDALPLGLALAQKLKPGANDVSVIDLTGIPAEDIAISEAVIGVLERA